MTIWLTKVLLSHLLADFLLQRTSWIQDRKQRKFASPYLYIHTIIASGLALLFTGWSYWIIALIIFVTHTLIDGLKSYAPDKPLYFLIDQAAHLLVILTCWWFTFNDLPELLAKWDDIKVDTDLWIKITGYFFVTYPASYLTGQLTVHWRATLPDADGLANAGKWIGIIERIIILTLTIYNQYEAIGLLITAKGIIRFSENNRTEQKTEYLVIGTLISMTIAILTGMMLSGLL
jgi:hypothetical protein